jgi:hypothetical protein
VHMRTWVTMQFCGRSALEVLHAFMWGHSQTPEMTMDHRLGSQEAVKTFPCSHLRIVGTGKLQTCRGSKLHNHANAQRLSVTLRNSCTERTCNSVAQVRMRAEIKAKVKTTCRSSMAVQVCVSAAVSISARRASPHLSTPMPMAVFSIFQVTIVDQMCTFSVDGRFFYSCVDEKCIFRLAMTVMQNQHGQAAESGGWEI